MDETLVAFGSEMKVLGETEDAWQIGGYGVVFGTRDVSSLKDEFDATTDYDFTDGEKRTLYYNHGLDGTIKKAKLGQVSLHLKDDGVWYEGELKKRSDYLAKHAERIVEGIKNGVFGTSTGAPSHLVDRVRDGEGHSVKMWPIAEVSITPTPAEPLTTCVSLKALMEIEGGASELIETQPPITEVSNESTKNLEILEQGQLSGSTLIDHSARVLAANTEFCERMADIASSRAMKAGRVLSEANINRLKEHHAALCELTDGMGKLLDEHMPPVESKSAELDAGKSLDAEVLDLEIETMRQRTRIAQALVGQI